MAGRPAGAIAEPGCLTPRSPGQMAATCAQYAQNTLDLSCMCRPSVKQMLSSPREPRQKYEGPCRAQLSLERGSLLNWVREDSPSVVAILYFTIRLPTLKTFQWQHDHENIIHSQEMDVKLCQQNMPVLKSGHLHMLTTHLGKLK